MAPSTAPGETSTLPSFRTKLVEVTRPKMSPALAPNGATTAIHPKRIRTTQARHPRSEDSELVDRPRREAKPAGETAPPNGDVGASKAGIRIVGDLQKDDEQAEDRRDPDRLAHQELGECEVPEQDGAKRDCEREPSRQGRDHPRRARAGRDLAGRYALHPRSAERDQRAADRGDLEDHHTVVADHLSRLARSSGRR